MDSKINPSFGAYYRINTADVVETGRNALQKMTKLARNGEEIAEHFRNKGFVDKVIYDIPNEKKPIMDKLLSESKILAEADILNIIA